MTSVIDNDCRSKRLIQAIFHSGKFWQYIFSNGIRWINHFAMSSVGVNTWSQLHLFVRFFRQLDVLYVSEVSDLSSYPQQFLTEFAVAKWFIVFFFCCPMSVCLNKKIIAPERHRAEIFLDFRYELEASLLFYRDIQNQFEQVKFRRFYQWNRFDNRPTCFI